MTSENRNTKEKNMVRVPAMSFVRSFLSYYRRNHRSLGTVTQYQGHCLLQQRSFSSANQRDTETSRYFVGTIRFWLILLCLFLAGIWSIFRTYAYLCGTCHSIFSDQFICYRSISAPRANPGPVTPPPSSGGPPIFTW